MEESLYLSWTSNDWTWESNLAHSKEMKNSVPVQTKHCHEPLPCVPQWGLLWLMLYMPCPYPLSQPEATRRQFSYISDASCVHGYSQNWGVFPNGWGGQSAGEFPPPGRTLKQWRTGVGGQITQVPSCWWENPGVGSVQFLCGCLPGLGSSHPQRCVTINTPFMVCPPLSHFSFHSPCFLGLHSPKQSALKFLT